VCGERYESDLTGNYFCGTFYIEIINESKVLIQAEYEPEKAEAIVVYLALVLDRCADKNSRLTIWDVSAIKVNRASTTHRVSARINKGSSFSILMRIVSTNLRISCHYCK